MPKTNKLKSASLEDSILKIETKSGETTDISVKAVTKVYIKKANVPFYYWLLFFLLLALICVVAYFFIDSKLSVFIFILLFFYFNKKDFSRKSYNFVVEFNDKKTYSAKIPYSMKEEIKSLIWNIRAILILNT
jgi:hypothetical protein